MTLGLGYGGAAYNHYVAMLMDVPTDELKRDVQAWNDSSFSEKAFKSIFRPRYNEKRLEVARDIIAAREDPSSPQAQNVNWRIEAFREKEAERQKRGRASNFLHSLTGD